VCAVGVADAGAAVPSGAVLGAWGANDAGQLGNGTVGSVSGTPVQVGGITTATQLAAGESHSLAVLANGSVMAWGSNSNGQLGNGTTTDSPTPVQVSGISTATHVAAGACTAWRRWRTGR
jgi:alpha-tubulin suppressor-like RCC1 family protein